MIDLLSSVRSAITQLAGWNANGPTRMVNLSGGFVNISGRLLLDLEGDNGRWNSQCPSSYTAGVKLFTVFAFVALSAATSSAAADKSVVIGTWEGESKCTVPESPCHDEHVIYTITAGPGDELTSKADKVVNGERQYMGSLPCRYDSAAKRLTCVTEGARRGDWVFIVSGNTMTGTLTLRKEGQLYRRSRDERQRESKK